MTARDWKELRAAAVRLLAPTKVPGDPLSEVITRYQAEEVANDIAEWLVANLLTPTDFPEGHRLAWQLADVAGTKQDIEVKLRPVTDK